MAWLTVKREQISVDGIRKHMHVICEQFLKELEHKRVLCKLNLPIIECILYVFKDVNLPISLYAV